MKRPWKGCAIILWGLWLDPWPLHAEDQSPMTPPGDCTKEEHRELKKAVGRACKSTSMTCDEKDDCATLWKNLIQRSACVAARQHIADRCFRGGDGIHRQEIDNYKKGVEDCRKYIKDKRCPPDPCECVEPVRGRRAPPRRRIGPSSSYR